MDRLIILGNFDGVHLAHKKLILKGIKEAKKLNLIPTVYTFKTLTGDKKYITTFKEKIDLIKKLGIEEIIVEDFEKVRNIKAIDFINNILKKELNAKAVCCGFNYRFGYKREGDTGLLSQNIISFIIEEYKINGVSVSSSNIREFLKEGKIKEANTLLGYDFFYSGKIIKGKQLGRTIGFPTANIEKDKNKIEVHYGVYGTYSYLECEKREFLSITNIGKNPTVKGYDYNIETNIYDFNKFIYDEEIVVHLKEKIRNEVKFSSLDELKNQIEKDKNIWKEKWNK